MGYVLATTERTVRWYVYDTSSLNGYKLVDRLDLNEVPMASDKSTAKNWAKALGLTSWRYIKI